MKTFKDFIREEGPVAVNAVSAGNVDGIGFGSKGEPGVNKKKRSVVMNTNPLKRRMPNVGPKVSS
jgi:hypothetical protein